MFAKMNVDCMLQILFEIPANERHKYRLVCTEWRDLIDYLSISQKCLECYSSLQFNCNVNQSGSVFCLQSGHITYRLFCELLRKYPNLRELTFAGFSQWNDHHLFRLTELCPHLHKLAFISSSLFGANYHNDFGFQSVTQLGWQNLTVNYGRQLSTLILEDCDLENHHLALIVKSFSNLRHLNILNNSEINNFTPLSNLSKTIEVLKIGPKLHSINKPYQLNHEIPVEQILLAKNIRLLNLQGYLTPKLLALSRLPNLVHLTLNYVSFSVFENIFNKEMDILIALITNFKRLTELNLYQFDEFNINDFQWLQHSFQTVNIPATTNSIHSNLTKFSFYSNKPLIVVNHFRLISIVLSSSPRLKCFSLSCSTQDPTIQNYNLNQTILVLLQKYGARLEQIKLENLLHCDSYFYLAYVILTNLNLKQFSIESCHSKDFLDCVELQLDQLSINGKLFSRSRPLNLTFLVSPEQKPHEHVDELCERLLPHINVNYRNQSSHGHLFESNVKPNNNLAINRFLNDDNDLSDLCMLIDSSFDLIGKLVDIITLLVNYVSLFINFSVKFSPSKVLSYSKSWLKLR